MDPKKLILEAQTRDLQFIFLLGEEKIPKGVIKALVIIKRAAAYANMELGKLPENKAKLIIQAAKKSLMENWIIAFLYMFGQLEVARILI